MNWDVRFGRFDRGADQPIFVKEKKGEDGSISTRIYQRKDLESITNPIAKAIKAIKYSFEDLCHEQPAVGKIFQFLGFPKINARKTLDRESFKDRVTAFQKIEREARFGFSADSDSRQKLFDFLGIDVQPGTFTTTVNPEKYDDAKFLEDLTIYLYGLANDQTNKMTVQQAKKLKAFFESLMQNIGLGTNLIADDRDSHNEYFKNRDLFIKTITKSSKNNRGDPNALEAFLKKFDTVFPERVEDLFGLSKMKSYALGRFDTELTFAKIQGKSTDRPEKAIKNMKRIFSTSPWVTKKQKLEAMQYFLDEQKTNPPLDVSYSLLRYFDNTLNSQKNNSTH